MTARLLAVATHALGVVAFVYPFFLPASPTDERLAHASDAPLLFSAFAALLVAIAVAELRQGRLGAKDVALLGVLAGVNALLRVPGALGGASLMFLLPILCGAVFGARFGFLLGATSMAASAAITGGIGPWLPFQMWALGWVGAGGALVRMRRAPGWGRIAVLAGYAAVAGLAFGALTNLWFWPFHAGPGDLAWRPGLGAREGLTHYVRFYVLTSLPWDAWRAIGNVVLVALLGRPLSRLFVRFRARLHATWQPVPPAGLAAEPVTPPRASMVV